MRVRDRLGPYRGTAWAGTGASLALPQHGHRGSGFRVSDDKRPGRTALCLGAFVCSVRYALVLLVFE